MSTMFLFKLALVGDVLFTALGAYVGYKYGSRAVAAATTVATDVKAAAAPVAAAAAAVTTAVKSA